MPSTEEWGRLFEAERVAPPIAVNAQTYRKSWNSFSKPVLLGCDDGREYVVKGSQVGRAVFNDQVVGRLGNALGIPVGDVILVNLSDELISMNSAMMGHMAAGLAHGCRFVPECSERMGIQHTNEAANRDRYSRLAVFYGWFLVAIDHQFFFTDTAPYLVHSFDHGHFLPDGPNWTKDSLALMGPPLPDTKLVADCQLNAQEIALARSLFYAVTPEMIAHAIGAVPAGWGGVTDSERVALADYLLARCAALRT